jgi:hypothetical protein
LLPEDLLEHPYAGTEMVAVILDDLGQLPLGQRFRLFVCQLEVHTPKVGSLTNGIKPSAEPVRRGGRPGTTFPALTGHWSGREGAGSGGAQPAVFRDRRIHCFFLTFFGQPRGVGAGQGARAGSPDHPSIGQSDGAQDLPLLSM